MKEWTTHHSCPDPECEDGEVTLTYEVGRSREDFFLTEDQAQCSQGHPIPPTVLDRWWSVDADEYEDYLFSKYEEARESHEQARFERHRLKED